MRTIDEVLALLLAADVTVHEVVHVLRIHQALPHTKKKEERCFIYISIILRTDCSKMSIIQ